MKRVCVFCGSSPGARVAYVETGQKLGRLLAERGLTLVYGGSHLGVMGAVADGALQAGGEVIGVLPQPLFRREVAHAGLTELIAVNTMHERKARMAELADAFVALPGGVGTLDEFCEIITWAQLGIHTKPCVLLNVERYFDSFLRLLDHAVEERFLRPEHRSLILEVSDLDSLFPLLDSYRPVHLSKYLDMEQT